MQISFKTKEESNKIQEEEFLKLTPVQRFYSFLALMHKSRKLAIKSKRNVKNDSTGNNSFQIIIND